MYFFSFKRIVLSFVGKMSMSKKFTTKTKSYKEKEEENSNFPIEEKKCSTTSGEGKLSQFGHSPWTEKYRPSKLDEISYQEHVVKALRKQIVSKNLPHLLLYGPPGVGKSSTILAV